MAAFSSYNSQHLPQLVTDAAGQSATIQYTPQGQIGSITRTRNQTAEVTGTFTYQTHQDQPGYRNVATITLPPVPGAPAATTRFTYDQFGNVDIMTGPDGYFVSYAYDALNRLVMFTIPFSIGLPG